MRVKTGLFPPAPFSVGARWLAVQRECVSELNVIEISRCVSHDPCACRWMPLRWRARFYRRRAGYDCKSKSSQSKTDGVYLERRDYRSPVHHSKGREKLNAVGCKLGGSVIVVNSKKGKGHTLKLNDCFGGWISGYRSRRLTGPSPSRVLSPCRWLGS